MAPCCIHTYLLVFAGAATLLEGAKAETAPRLSKRVERIRRGAMVVMMMMVRSLTTTHNSYNNRLARMYNTANSILKASLQKDRGRLHLHFLRASGMTNGVIADVVL